MGHSNGWALEVRSACIVSFLRCSVIACIQTQTHADDEKHTQHAHTRLEIRLAIRREPSTLFFFVVVVGTFSLRGLTTDRPTELCDLGSACRSAHVAEARFRIVSK